MLRGMSVAQYDKWFYYSQREPFGYPLHDITQASVASAILNATGSFEPMLSINDCLLSIGDTPAKEKAVDEDPGLDLKKKFRSG
jgi:hypothetical protein